MKQKVLYTAVLILLLTLCGCSAKESSVPETTAVQTEAVTVPTEPTPTEQEKIKEIVMAESYYFNTYVDDVSYQRYITLYPNAGFYDARWSQESSWGTYVLEDDGRISVDLAGESCVFRRTESQLVLESGRFNIFSDTGVVEVVPGTASWDKHVSKLKGGIYVLDTAKYDFTFDKVLIDLNLTDMRFTMKCFDGSVVEGTLAFMEDHLICTYEGGKMMFDVSVYGLMDTRTDLEKGSVMTAQLMFCPQIDTSMRPYTFLYAEDQEREITVDPDIIPLDSFKHLYKRSYEYRCYVTKEDADKLCVFNIHHYPLEGKWEFADASDAEEVTMEEKSDGTIVFSQGGKQWHFHREGEYLYYDGGSSLTATGYDANTQSYSKAEVPSGAMFHVFEENYLYDGLYILPYETLEETYAAIQIDTKNRYLWIHCYDGAKLEGPYTYEGNFIRFRCEVTDPYFGTHIEDVELHPNEHGLHVWNKGMRDVWEILIGPGEISDSFLFFPVQGVEYQNLTAE